MSKKRIILWSYCPNKYMFTTQEKNNGSGPNINLVFQGNRTEKEDWKDDEDDSDSDNESETGREVQLWMGDTNFDVSPEIAESFGKIVGVEFCRILTRYCFIISPGALFNFSEIRREIENTFCDKIESEEMVKLLKGNYKYWTLYINGKGELDYACTNIEKDERFVEDVSFFKLSHKKNGGQIIEGN